MAHDSAISYLAQLLDSILLYVNYSEEKERRREVRLIPCCEYPNRDFNSLCGPFIWLSLSKRISSTSAEISFHNHFIDIASIVYSQPQRKIT
jgi:hypothetical protein